MYVGIDLAAGACHCVAIDPTGAVRDVRLFDASDLDSLASWARGAKVVAVDAPAQLSTAPHEDDPELKPKFALARCAEIALGREHRIWVPLVAPMTRPEHGWIATGLSVHERLAREGLDVIEVYPHAGFCALAGARTLPKKQTADGLRTRADLLERVGVRERSLEMWSDDGLHALVGAVTARDRDLKRAQRVTCGHDDSAIWLPPHSPA